MIELLAFDGDDTLWHNEFSYIQAARKFEILLAQHYGLKGIEGEIYETEKKNIRLFGYGIKGYTISMVETAIRLTEGRIEGKHISSIVDYGKEMLEHEIELLPGARELLEQLTGKYRLLLITKGDQFEQEAKVRRSGLAGHFRGVEIVSEKSVQTYADLLEKYKCQPPKFVMVGNSLRSNIHPVVKLGGMAVYIPYELTWQHENHLDEPLDPEHFHQINSLMELPSLLESIS
jgi:putative hydrolase of the HAD superfamily